MNRAALEIGEVLTFRIISSSRNMWCIIPLRSTNTKRCRLISEKSLQRSDAFDGLGAL